jgi:ArsR family transcriptional regulator
MYAPFMVNATFTNGPMTDAPCCPQLLGGALSDEDAQVAARVFKALADPARVRLLSLIASAPGGEACVCDLVESLDLSQPTISHHLRLLLEAGLVDRERRGTWAYYRLRPETVDAMSQALAFIPARVG